MCTIGTMNETEIKTRELRDAMAEHLNAVQHRGEVRVITRNGSRAAALVPLTYLQLKAADEGNSAFRFLNLGRRESTQDVAAQLRQLAADSGGAPTEMPAGELAAIEFLLKEFAARCFTSLGTAISMGQLAQDLAEQITRRQYGQVPTPPIATTAVQQHG